MERTGFDHAESSVHYVDKTDFIGWVGEYIEYLRLEERSPLTLQQYRHDILQFIGWLDKRAESSGGAGNHPAGGKDSEGRLALSKEAVIAYKEKLRADYEACTVNAKLAAVNSFFSHIHMEELRVKQLRLQRRTFCPKEKELTQAEYERLVKAAKKLEDRRPQLIIETLCSTGIRVSELKFITVEAVKEGKTTIQLKGKTRQLLLPQRLCKLLREYIEQEKLVKGPVFVTSTGKNLDRSNIWRMMKSLCEAAHVDPAKVYPHNLRHLFARCFYALSKDIAKLADLLGHSSIDTTRLYIITTGEEHQRQMDLLDLVI